MTTKAYFRNLLLLAIIVVGSTFVFVLVGEDKLDEQSKILQTPTPTVIDSGSIHTDQPTAGNKSDANRFIDWNIYTDERYGFRMSIPSDWKVESVVEGMLLELTNTKREYFIEGSKISPIQVRLIDNPMEWTVDDLIGNDFELPIYDGYSAERSKTVVEGRTISRIDADVWLWPAYELVESNVIIRFINLAGSEKEDRMIRDMVSSIIINE